jgi:hypothetical protein
VEKQTPAQLQERAYHIWDRAGRPHGHALDHWLQAQAEAEAEARAEKPKRRTRKATSTKAKAAPATAKPKQVAKSARSAPRTRTGRKPTAPSP